ncbi:hypothetical protein AOX55_00003458 [Sinorhizobium fredii CCBAU 25509]|nr:hypothetical protein SF83666_c27510 [Sinorhizobium fredii CCBAU 83666]ASY70614.1 hypothetical protein SF83666_c32120 [Sinorhizobium fredii CCBAU 83666]ASY71026.1 hypothetical protein SF83666_c36330 [Sinorhizobium fredii CCBAU 83666]AWM26210.1 hypothetical protein AOX55_00002964 [Sinorhizobium fredii CCBAU 25509]AWM26693.1 hypothetical protein AOX55_00003458 [Sinorhizobium fredii CCBAU 25509]
MASKGLGSDADTDRLSTTAVNTWKLPDISSLHNFSRTGIHLSRDDANLIFSKDTLKHGTRTKPKAS